MLNLEVANEAPPISMDILQPDWSSKFMKNTSQNLGPLLKV